MAANTEQVVHQIMQGSHTATYGGSAVTILSGLTINEWGVIIGATVAVLGLIVGTATNIWFRREQLKIMREKD